MPQTCEWLKGEGKESDIVISTRIRLARNIQNYSFGKRAQKKELEVLERLIHNKISKLPEFSDYSYLVLNELSANELQFLLERHLISKEHIKLDWRRAVCFKNDESISIMINEEDHLRIQMIQSGFATVELWKKIDSLDDEISNILPYCFHERFGYITACPTNTGTGLRVSAMLHLPGLRMTEQMEKISQLVGQLNFVFRGLYGEGTAALGDFFQLSNQITLGVKEADVVKSFTQIIEQILIYERKIRAKMAEKNLERLQKEVEEAYYILKEAKALTTKQAMTHLSLLRLGIHMGLLPLMIQDVNNLFLKSQPAHLQMIENKVLKAEKRDEIRAEYFRKQLQNTH